MITFAPARELALQAGPLLVRVRGRGVEGAGDGEAGRLSDGRAGLVLAHVQAPNDLDQADGVDVPYGPGRELVGRPRRIAGQREDVADAQGVGAEQLGFEGHEVSVARRQVDQAFEVEVVLDAEGHGHGAHSDPSRRRVADVHQVHAGLLQEPGGLECAVDSDRARRIDLDRDDVRAGGELAGQLRRRRRLAVEADLTARRARGRCGGVLALGVFGARRDGSSAAAFGGQGVDCGPHRGGMRRRGTATATDDRGAGGEHARNHLPEVLGLGRIDEAAFDALGEPRVRLQRARHEGAGRTGADERLKAGERARAAVDPNGVDVGLGERSRRGGGSGAVGQQEVLAEGHLRDHRQVAGSLDLLDRGKQCLDVAERLAHQQIDAAFEKPFDLLAEGGPGEPGMRSILDSERRAERADRTGDERLASGDVSRLAGKLSAASAHLAGQLFESELGQTEAVGAESIGLYRVGAGLQVFAMDLGDDIGVGQHDLVEAGPLRECRGCRAACPSPRRTAAAGAAAACGTARVRSGHRECRPWSGRPSGSWQTLRRVPTVTRCVLRACRKA
jgi:hypothetical protein